MLVIRGGICGIPQLYTAFLLDNHNNNNNNNNDPFGSPGRVPLVRDGFARRN